MLLTVMTNESSVILDDCTRFSSRPLCHDLAKMAKLLSIFLFFSFLFLFFLSWTYYTEGSVGKCYVTSVTQSHDRKSQCHIT